VISLAEVRLWGKLIGAVQWNAERRLGVFEYEPGFLRSGIQLAPLQMPLRPGTFAFPELNYQSFHGLPGMLADALPDKFGNLLIDQWLVANGRSPEDFNPVERLLYMGQRGMGALEFAPASRRAAPVSESLELAELVSLANRALAQKKNLATAIHSGAEDQHALQQIISVGTSAGGARAKAVVAWNPETGEVRSGQLDASEGFRHYLLKFDGVDGNSDKELADPQGFTRIEYAYYLMATAAGITMMPSHLLEENGRAHFMTERFDREGGAGRLHMQTLCGLAHYDFNQAGGYSYEQCFRVIRQLEPDNVRATLEQQYLRMLFNLMSRNQDDHTKNIAFLMDKRGLWRLSPAYDVTFAWNPEGLWTSQHQMSVNGRRDHFTMSDLLAAAAAADVREHRAYELVAQVRGALERWSEYADAAGVPSDWAQRIEAGFRLFK